MVGSPLFSRPRRPRYWVTTYERSLQRERIVRQQKAIATACLIVSALSIIYMAAQLLRAVFA